jgi:quinol monooxygenase YgiN
MSHFVCLAQFISKPGKENDLIKALSSLIEPTRAESGCISYDLHQDINQPRKLTMIEFFKSKEAFDFHAKQSYLTLFQNIASELIESRQLTFCLSQQ